MRNRSMKNFIKIICICVLIACIGAVGFVAYLGFTGGLYPLDKGKMEYDWRENELYGTWRGVDGSSLDISADEIVLNQDDEVFRIQYDIDEANGPKIKLKTNNPYEYFLFSKDDTIHVLSGFMQNDMDQYVITNEFVSDKDSISIDSSFKSDYRLMYEKSMFMSETYTINNMESYSDYLGKSKSELGIENKYINNEGSFFTINISSSLFDTPVSGVMYSEIDDSKDIESLCIEEIDVYSYDLSYDDIYNRFNQMYTLDSQGDEPYAVSNGGEVSWALFYNGKSSIRITHGSEANYVMIQYW